MERSVRQYLDYVQYEKRYAQNTVIAYRKDIDQAFHYLQQQYQVQEWSQVEYVMIRSWVFELSDAGIDRISINRKISSLRSFFRFLKKNEIIAVNPMTKIQTIKVSKSLPSVVPYHPLQIFLEQPCVNWVEFRDQMLIQLFYETGIRRAELIEATYNDIRWQDGQLRVLGKGQKWRLIPLRMIFMEKLQAFRKLTQTEFANPSPNIILRDNGESCYPKWVYNRVKHILSGISNSEKLSPHILRHSIATHLLDQGADVRVIKEFLGHSSIATTQIYTQNSIEKLKAAYRASLPNLDQIIP